MNDSVDCLEEQVRRLSKENNYLKRLLSQYDMEYKYNQAQTDVKLITSNKQPSEPNRLLSPQEKINLYRSYNSQKRKRAT